MSDLGPDEEILGNKEQMHMHTYDKAMIGQDGGVSWSLGGLCRSSLSL